MVRIGTEACHLMTLRNDLTSLQAGLTGLPIVGGVCGP
jgi:hypothetical protein